MRVRFLTSIAINHDGTVATYQFGEKVDLPDHEAEAHIAAAHAELAEPEPPADEPVVETAVAARPEEETAVRLPKQACRKGAK